MKKISILLVLFTFVVTGINAEPITIKVSKAREERQVSDFSGVASSGYVNVVIKMGTTEDLRLEGDADAIADLITEVKGNILTIRPKTKIYWDNKFKNAKVTAYITAKKITSLTMSGSAEMRVEDPLTANNFTATLSGSGSIKATTDAKSFVGVLSGSGALYISGRAGDANITLSGSGNFNGKDFAVDDLSTQVSGSGNVNVSVSGDLKATIVGSGNVNYSGNARVEKTTVGSGRVRKV